MGWELQSENTFIVSVTRPCKHTCDGGRLWLLLSEDGVAQVSQVLQAAVDVKVCRQPAWDSSDNMC